VQVEFYNKQKDIMRRFSPLKKRDYCDNIKEKGGRMHGINQDVRPVLNAIYGAPG
jgi:hypothetical protein